MNYGLSEETVSKISGVLAAHPEVEKAVLYGSRAKGNYKNGSDIDLCLIGENLTTERLFTIDDELDDLLLPYTIDLSIQHQIGNPDLLEHIERVGKVFYGEGSTSSSPSPSPSSLPSCTW